MIEAITFAKKKKQCDAWILVNVKVMIISLFSDSKNAA